MGLFFLVFFNQVFYFLIFLSHWFHKFSLYYFNHYKNSKTKSKNYSSKHTLYVLVLKRKIINFLEKEKNQEIDFIRPSKKRATASAKRWSASTN